MMRRIAIPTSVPRSPQREKVPAGAPTGRALASAAMCEKRQRLSTGRHSLCCLNPARSRFEDDGAAAPLDCLRERFRGSCEWIGGSDVDVELALREIRGEHA